MIFYIGIGETHHSLPLLYSVVQAGQQRPGESTGVSQLSTSLEISPRTTWLPLRVVTISRCSLNRANVKSLPGPCSLLTPTCFWAARSTPGRPPEHSRLPRSPGGRALEHLRPCPCLRPAVAPAARRRRAQKEVLRAGPSSHRQTLVFPRFLLSPFPVSPFYLSQRSPN